MEDPQSFLTNIDPEDKDIILQAAKDTEFPIFIKKEAYSASGKLLPDLIAVHSQIKGRDHSVFWNRFHELNKRKNDMLSPVEEQIRNQAMNQHMDKIKKFIAKSGEVQEAMRKTSAVIQQVPTVSDFRDKLVLSKNDESKLSTAGDQTLYVSWTMIEMLDFQLEQLERLRRSYSRWFHITEEK